MPEVTSSKYLVRAGWDDVPHLDEKAKAELRAAIPPHLLKARSEGYPSLGAGAVYPIDLESVKERPFLIPPYWIRSYALDVGWNKTAALWGAYDRAEDVIHVYSEHYVGEQQPSVHARSVKARGEWIPGVIDPAARGRSQADGTKLMETYIDQGLILTPAPNSVEGGIYEVWDRLGTGRLKFFDTLVNLFFEYAIYRRDEKGKIVKKFDHLMDCLRYLVNSILDVGVVRPLRETNLHLPPAYGVPGTGY